MLSNGARLKADSHLCSLPAAIIMKLVYGYDITGSKDHFISLAEQLSKLTTESTEPGRWLVDSFPKRK